MRSFKFGAGLVLSGTILVGCSGDPVENMVQDLCDLGASADEMSGEDLLSAVRDIERTAIEEEVDSDLVGLELQDTCPEDMERFEEAVFRAQMEGTADEAEELLEGF